MKLLFTAFFSLVTLLPQAQTADEIIQKYTANMGGLEAYTKISTAKFTGAVALQGMDLPLVTHIINGKASHTSIEAMGIETINCYHEGKGWKISPLEGSVNAVEVTSTELNDFKAQSSLSSPLMDYKARGHKVELAGKETVEGITTWKIKLTAKEDGRITTYFISTKDYTLIKSVTTKQVQGNDTAIETYYSDLKTFEGAKFFMLRNMQIGGSVFQSVSLNTAEFNVKIDNSIFEMPK